MNFRFKSTLSLNTKDGEENTDVVTNSVITANKKFNAKPDDGEVELVPNSAEAGSEFNWGFLLWSFMNFGAENAIAGHSGYWLSNKNVVHDYWQAVFNKPQIIDTIQITWRLPPKRLKLFYKLDENTDWIGATEVFIREEVKDKNGNLIPDDSSTNYNTVYFKKPLLCTRVKIMMNQPIRKKSFSIDKVNFFNKIGRGIIKAPLLNKQENYCWYINTNLIRKEIPVYVYPCIEAISIGLGTEMFQINTNKQIKPYQSELCVGYKTDTKEVVLKDCQEEGSGYLINYNSDTSMFFVGMPNTAISVDKSNKYPNYINEQTETIASSEADKLDFRKENMLTEGGNYWASEPGLNEVTIQILFGKIKCQDCKEDGAYESRKIDIININWVREPKKFSVFIWNPGYSWKNIATFENNTEKVTQLSLVGEIAAGLMIRMVEGNKFENLGNVVSYAIISVYASFRGHVLKIMPQSKKPLAMRFFDFEAQNFLGKKKGNALEEGLKELGQNYEKAISAYKNLKSSVGALKQSKNQAKDICKKLNMLNESCGPKGYDKLKKFETEHLRKITNYKFLFYLKKFSSESTVNYLIGLEYDDSDSDFVSGTPEEEDQFANKNFYKNPLSKIEDQKNYLKNVSGAIANKKSNLSNNNDASFNNNKININDSNELYANKIFSQGTSSKAKQQRDDSATSRELGSKAYPAVDCLQIKKANSNSLSGFYYIMPECSPVPIRVFCDFALYADAVDLYIFKDGSKLQTADLSYLKIKTHEDVKAQCAKYGLHPIEIKNKDTLTRVHQILVATGMNLNYPNFVPLGYDYTCKFSKCSKIFNSLNSEKSFPLMNFFAEENQDFGSSRRKAPKNGLFAGLGTSDASHMVLFEPNSMVISALVCSTNDFESRNARKIIKQIDCEFTLAENLDSFDNSLENVYVCAKNCQNSLKEVLGNGAYHSYSSICKAGIHAGILSGNGGKVVVRLHNAQSNYVGLIQNGIKSLDYVGDGLHAFIVYRYTPNCPRVRSPSSGNKPISFIEQAESVELKKEDKKVKNVDSGSKSVIMSDENFNKNKSISNVKEDNKSKNDANTNRNTNGKSDLNSLHVNILLDSILNGANSDKNSDLSKKIQLLKQLIPSAYLDAKQSASSTVTSITENKNSNESHKEPKTLISEKNKTELEKIKSEKLPKQNSEMFNKVRFFEKNQNTKLNTNDKSDSKQIPNASGLTSLAANAAANLFGEAVNSPAVSTAGTMANALGNAVNGGANFLKGLFPGGSGGANIPNGSAGANSAPQISNNNDALAAQNQAFAGQAQGDSADFNNPFSSGTSSDDVAGRYSTPNSLMGSSISNPTNNPLMTGSNALSNQMSNVSKANASAQKYQDPNLAMNGSFSSDLENNSHPSNTPGSMPQTPVSVEGDLAGQKSANSNQNQNPNRFDLSRSSNNNSSQGNLNLMDPNDMKDDSNPNNDLPGGPDDNGDMEDSSFQSGDVPGNHGYGSSGSDTEKAKSKLNRLAESSIGKDLNKIKEKVNKIDKAISQFVNNLNQACNGNANTNAIDRESAADSYGNGESGNNTIKSNSNRNGYGRSGSSGSNSSNVNIMMQDQSSLGVSYEDDSPGNCNISNAPALYNQLAENEHKMDDYIKHLMRECAARVYKTKQIELDRTERYQIITAQDPVKIDYSKYQDEVTANEVIFGKIFEVLSLGSNEIYKSTWSIRSKNLKTRKRALGIEFNPSNQSGYASSMILLKGKVYYDVTIKVDVMMANNGTAGIIFRAKNQYNFYAFIIDKTTGNKALVRVVNGEIDILKKISDGGILINQWHSIVIEVRANKISVYIYDAESPNKTSTEKTIILEDNTFVKGSVGIFTNGVKGFYFDNFSTMPSACWSPWVPKPYITVRNSNSNFYIEDFKGVLIEKYEIHDLDDKDARDGPAMWNLVREFTEFGEYIEQTSAVYDKTSRKRSHFLTLKNKNLQNGIFMLQFIPGARNGIISVIFKYNEILDTHKSEDKTVQYYTFEMNNESPEPRFTLKMYLNGESKVIQSISVSQLSNLSYAYVAQRINTVKIEVINESITVKVSQENREFFEVFNLTDNKIAYGTIGFGTYRTPARFFGIYINPPKMKMTNADVDFILNKRFVELPFPSPWRIKEATIKSNYVRQLSVTNTALGNLYHQISLLRSSLGFDFGNVKTESYEENEEVRVSETEVREDYEFKNIFGWRRCVVARNDVARKNYCENQFESEFMKEKCQADFCNACCSENVDPKNLNILHMCKKACYKSTLAIDHNSDYKQVCINSNDYRANIYEFCDRKMINLNKKLLAFCKLDMCNLCCVGMDKIRNKNFSVNNLQSCFNDCASEYNVPNLTEGNIVMGKRQREFDQIDILSSENTEDFRDLVQMSSININSNLDINDIIREGSVQTIETSSSKTVEDNSGPSAEEIAKIIESHVDRDPINNLPPEVLADIKEKEKEEGLEKPIFKIE